jgi:hypothetical protein
VEIYIGVDKMKKSILIIVMIALMAISAGGGYIVATQSNQQEVRDSYTRGFLSGNDTGYKLGVDSIQSKIPKDVSYAEVVKFVKEDVTNEYEYDGEYFNCEDYSRIVRDRANAKGIRCGYVELTVNGGAHALNVFMVTEGYLVYMEPQDDTLLPSENGEVSIGGNYKDELRKHGSMYGKYISTLSESYGDNWVIKRVNIIW